jgi:predicted RNase H-like HicB family nuclease
MERENREIIERDGDWFVGWSLDVPGANGQGRTVEECRESIAAAIELILEDQR